MHSPRLNSCHFPVYNKRYVSTVRPCFWRVKTFSFGPPRQGRFYVATFGKDVTPPVFVLSCEDIPSRRFRRMERPPCLVLVSPASNATTSDSPSALLHPQERRLNALPMVDDAPTAGKSHEWNL